MTIPAIDEGLRARKQRQTRQNIAEAGFALFLDRGFDAATLDDIAAAASVSRRTVLNYFQNKEDILLAWESELENSVRAAIFARPGDERPLAMVRAVLLELTQSFESERAVAIDRLMHATDALRARKQASWERKEQVLTEALAVRSPDPAARTGLRLAAMIGIAALRASTDLWRAENAPRDLRFYLDEAFEVMRHEFDEHDDGGAIKTNREGTGRRRVEGTPRS